MFYIRIAIYFNLLFKIPVLKTLGSFCGIFYLVLLHIVVVNKKSKQVGGKIDEQ